MILLKLSNSNTLKNYTIMNKSEIVFHPYFTYKMLPYIQNNTLTHNNNNNNNNNNFKKKQKQRKWQWSGSPSLPPKGG
jgi:hypothetical protein